MTESIDAIRVQANIHQAYLLDLQLLVTTRKSFAVSTLTIFCPGDPALPWTSSRAGWTGGDNEIAWLMTPA